MAKWKIGSSKGGETVSPGTYKDAVFTGLEKFTTTKDSKELYRWKFEVDGVQVNSISGVDKPTTKNAFGKNLCAISGQSLAEGIEVGDPEEYIGGKFIVMVEQKDSGAVVTMFTKMPV